MKTRWQEVALISGLQAAAQYTLMQAMHVSEQTRAADIVLPLAAFLFVLFFVISKMLSFGFIRTGFLDGPLRHEPAMLLKIGHHFFWRMIGFELLVGLIFVAVFTVLLVIGQVAGYGNAKEQSSVIVAISMLCAVLILAKPLLLGPASIIVTDCGILDAFGKLRYYTLRHAKGTLVLFFMWLAGIGTPTLIAAAGYKDIVENYFIMAAFAVVNGFFAIAVYLSAVKAVADVYLSMPEDEHLPTLTDDDTTEFSNKEDKA